MIQYRIGWSMNIVGTDGDSGWVDWEGPEDTEDAVRAVLEHRTGTTSRALEEALEGAGFDFWIEIRQSPDSAQEDHCG